MPARVSSESRQPADRGMGPEIEFRQGRSSRATRTAIANEALPREKRSLPWQRQPTSHRLGQRLIQVLDPVESDRYLLVNHPIDRQRRLVPAGDAPVRRSVMPLRVLGHHILQNLAVDGDGAQRPPRVSARISSVLMQTVPFPVSMQFLAAYDRSLPIRRRNLLVSLTLVALS